MLEVFRGAKWRPRARKNGSQKSLKNMSNTLWMFEQCWGPIGVQHGPRKVQIRDPESGLRSSRVPRAFWGSILDGCLTIVGTVFVLCSEGIRTFQDDMLLITLMNLKRLLRHLVRYLEKLVCCLPCACVYFVEVGIVPFGGGFHACSNDFAASTCSCLLFMVNAVEAAPQVWPKIT